jgi:hypothetical protein
MSVKTIRWVVFLLVLFSLGSCYQGVKMNQRVTIWRKDKIPYGTFYTFEQLPHIFPNAEVIIDKESPDKRMNIFQPNFSDIQFKLNSNKGKTAQVIICHEVYPSPSEVKALMNFVYEGNQLFISAFEIGRELLDTLDLRAAALLNYYDSLTVSVQNPLDDSARSFTYPGKSYDSYFSSLDSGYTTVLGWDDFNRPNFVKIGYDNGGAIYLHLAPTAFSNFFLLHKENKCYYDLVFSNLPQSTELVVWGDYFRTHKNGADRAGARQTFAWMMSQPALAWMVSLALLLFLLIYLFESKRKRRPIPVRLPLRNSSLDFVKTIGRLYYQRRDNKNLVQKMTAHFLDYVRSRYNIPTSRIDDEFINKLSYKTGIDHSLINNIVYQSKYLSDKTSVTDSELLFYNDQLQNFYKQA